MNNLLKQIEQFLANLKKDNQTVLHNIAITETKLIKLNEFQHNFNALKIEHLTLEGTEKEETLVKCEKTLDLISNILFYRHKENIDYLKMESFELKTATSLIPCLTEKEESVFALIDAIDLYDSMLKEDGKKLLTAFVLKTRLTQSAKIRMKQKYSSNKDLIKDLRDNLTTLKSPISLSSQLNGAQQKPRQTMEEYGQMIEKLFVDLTLAQANHDEEKFEFLKGINERTAIDCFSRGLTNPEIRTIIRARNFGSLKDAIRAAKDEEVNVPTAAVCVVNNREIGYFGRLRGNRYNFNGPRTFRNQRNLQNQQNFPNQRHFPNRHPNNNNNFFRNRNNGVINNAVHRVEVQNPNGEQEEEEFFRGQ